jgi:hypothetical protein
MITAYFYLVATEELTFDIWSQITYLGEDLNLYQLSIFTHQHSLRYAVVKIFVFDLADLLGIDSAYFFSIVVAVMIVLSGLLLARTRTLLLGKRNWLAWEAVWFVSLMVSLSFFMNGRLAFGLLGHTLLIWAEISWLKQKLSWLTFTFFLGLAIFLCAVSSGVFAVAVASVFFWGFVLSRATPRYLSRTQKLLLNFLGIGFAIPVIPLLSLYLRNNIAFYGGGFDGFIEMLAHGPGVVFLGEDSFFFIMILIVCLIFASVMFLMVWRFIRVYPTQGPLWSSLICALSIGVYGYSTLASGLPALLVLGTLLIRRLLTWGNRSLAGHSYVA